MTLAIWAWLRINEKHVKKKIVILTFSFLKHSDQKKKKKKKKRELLVVFNFFLILLVIYYIYGL